jgi:hypothetical protein
MFARELRERHEKEFARAQEKKYFAGKILLSCLSRLSRVSRANRSSLRGSTKST